MRVGWGWIQRAGALALLVGSLGVAGVHVVASSRVVFLTPSRSAPWIMAPTPVSAGLEQWGRAEPPVTAFSRRLALAEVPPRVVLVVRGLRRFGMTVNGAVPEGGRSSEAEDWRRPRRIDVTSLLRVGENELRVVASHRNGPALLSLESEGLDPPLRSGESWYVSLDDQPVGAAIAADDTRVNPASFAVETPLEGLLRCATVLLGLLALGALARGGLLRSRASRVVPWLPALALLAASLAWAGLLARKGLRLPLLVGFDARHHLAYVDFIRTELAVPLATDGWSMFHPPLFYAIAALVAPLGDWALRALPWLAGLGCVFVTRSLAARLYPGEPRVAFLAVLFAAVLPVNLYSAAYFTNETLHALLASLALLATVDALLAPRLELRHAVLVGLWFGLAALTKFTALALAPVALFFLAAKGLALERPAFRRVVVRLAVAGGLMVVIAGAYYARNVIHFGTPILGNWGRMPGIDHAWWQQPGFHSLAYYTGFGESLRHPYLAGFHSFWDGVYSTFWGDGGIAGRVFPSDRHGLWSYDYMSAGYLLGVLATALLILGAAQALVGALRDPDRSRRIAFSFLLTASYAVVFSLAFLTLRLPFFAQAKASYALCLVAPLAIFFASGAARVDDALAAPRLLPLRLAFAGALAATLGSFFLGFAG
jgi:hypothetical protein